MPNLYLAHYGIIGQKWGIRRYQNLDGTLTAAGKGRYSKSEIKADNKEAFANGRRATLAGRKMYYAKKLNRHNREKLNADETNSVELKRNYKISSKIEKEETKAYKDALTIAVKHADSLVNKYGKVNVSDIKYKTMPDGTKVVNESIYTGKQKALGALTFIVANLPLGTAWLYPLIPMPAGVKGAASVGLKYHKQKQITNPITR